MGYTKEWTQGTNKKKCYKFQNWVLWPARKKDILGGCSEHARNSVLRKLSQKGGEFTSSVDYIRRPCPRTQLLQKLESKDFKFKTGLDYSLSLKSD